MSTAPDEEEELSRFRSELRNPFYRDDLGHLSQEDATWFLASDKRSRTLYGQWLDAGAHRNGSPLEVTSGRNAREVRPPEVAALIAETTSVNVSQTSGQTEMLMTLIGLKKFLGSNLPSITTATVSLDDQSGRRALRVWFGGVCEEPQDFFDREGTWL